MDSLNSEELERKNEKHGFIHIYIFILYYVMLYYVIL